MRPCQCSNVYTLILILLLFAAKFFPLPIFSALSYFFPVYRSRSAAVCQPVQPAGDSAAPWRSPEFLFAESLACPRGKCCRISYILWNLGNLIFSATCCSGFLSYYVDLGLIVHPKDHWLSLWKEKNLKKQQRILSIPGSFFVRVTDPDPVLLPDLYSNVFPIPKHLKMWWRKMY